MHAAGNVDVNPVEGQKTATGAQKESFGTGSSAQSEAGKKGGAISGKFGCRRITVYRLCQRRICKDLAVVSTDLQRSEYVRNCLYRCTTASPVSDLPTYCAAGRSAEDRKASAQKAADTRAERYGDEVSNGAWPVSRSSYPICDSGYIVTRLRAAADPLRQVELQKEVLGSRSIALLLTLQQRTCWLSCASQADDTSLQQSAQDTKLRCKLVHADSV